MLYRFMLPLVMISCTFLGLIAGESDQKPLDADAVIALNLALDDAKRAAAHLNQADDASMKAAMVQCDMFTVMMAKIAALDARVMATRKSDIDAVTASLVVPVTEYRQRLAKAELDRSAAAMERIRTAEATKAADLAARQAEAQEAAAVESAKRAQRTAEDRAQRAQEAQSLGFSSSALGLCVTARDLMAQRVTLAAVKSTLFFPVAAERFTVTGVVEDYAIYATVFRDTSLQIAVKKKDGVFYGVGSPLGHDRLRFLEVRTFTYADGGNREVLTFATVEPTPTGANP